MISAQIRVVAARKKRIRILSYVYLIDKKTETDTERDNDRETERGRDREISLF